MPRPKAVDGLSLADLNNLLAMRRKKLAALARERRKVEARLDQIDREMSVLNGEKGGRVTAGGRARNAKSLPALLVEVLSENGKPMGVGDIADAVLKKGYRTTSDSFRGIVNQTLIKDKRFHATERGVYAMKK
jgi:hypothetical protein